ncbi:MAG: FAD-dependent oxidoreductase [Candidatus Marinimicrobia bacterium]|nr:FAD-dependent oxidoreductase [Candidatus Neomarinimicrobiota bacterium]
MNRSNTFTFQNKPDQLYQLGITEPSPCTLACPAGVNVKSYVSLISSGRFQEALNVVRERNPLPGICGRICSHPCEATCSRNEIDSPVAISWLKRFVADYELNHPGTKPKKIKQTRKENIAIIGSGPAGLTAANDLIRLGYGVTIFEALQKPGGMLITGIPSFRLPRDIVKVEIDAIKALGVKIKTNNKIKGKDAIKKLMSDGFDTVFLAVGAHKGKKLRIPGEDTSRGIINCVDFSNQVHLGTAPNLGKKVIVIGGGNVAIDTARTALRVGAQEVQLYCLESRKEMPAFEHEIEQAEKEGVVVNPSWGPKQILSRNGSVTGVEFRNCISVFDSEGRFNPAYSEETKCVNTEMVISAIGQDLDLDFLGKDHKLKITKRNTFEVDKDTLSTSMNGVFAGGDAVLGASTVIDAIAQGHIAARSIHRYLNHKPLQQDKRTGSPQEWEFKVEPTLHEKSKRATMPMMDIPGRKNNFTEVESGFDEATAIAEASRCLRCGPCSECFICMPECGKEVALISGPNGQEASVFRIPPLYKTLDPAHSPWDGSLVTGKNIVPVRLNALIPFVNETLCRGCGDCVDVCDYDAVKLIPKTDEISIAKINDDICRACGTCVAVCSPSAIIPRYFNQVWLDQKFNAMDPNKKNVVVFTCQWNGSHIEGAAFPDFQSKNTNILFVHFMCSGRLESSFIFRALNKGADGVLVTSCSAGECHYDFGVSQAQKTVKTTRQLIHLLGLDSKRFAYSQILGADPEAFIQAVNEFIKALPSKDQPESVSKINEP